MHQNLIQFLFPGWKIQNQDGAESSTNYMFARLHPQGIASDSKVDYFDRAFAEELSEKELSDQSIMHLLLDYNNNKVSAAELIAKAIESERYAERIEYFGKLLSPTKILELTSVYFKKIFDLQPHIKLGDYELTAILWRMSLDNYDTEENLRNWFETQINTYLHRSMMFTNDIFYFWRNRTRSDADIENTSPKILKTYIEKIKQLAENPEQLVEVLKFDMPFIWSLRHIVFGKHGNEEIKKAAEDKFFTNWQPWLMNSLLEASKQAPETVAMYTAPLLYDLINTVHDISTDPDDDIKNKIKRVWSAKFDEEIGKRLFGNDLKKIMKIVTVLEEKDYKNYSDLDEQTKILLDYAVTHSKQWIRDNVG